MRLEGNLRYDGTLHDETVVMIQMMVWIERLVLLIINGEYIIRGLLRRALLLILIAVELTVVVSVHLHVDPVHLSVK